MDALWSADADGNLLEGQTVALDTRDCTVYAPAGRMVATIGVEGLVVIQTHDATLVMPKDKAQDVRAVVKALEERKWDTYL